MRRAEMGTTHVLIVMADTHGESGELMGLGCDVVTMTG